MNKVIVLASTLFLIIGIGYTVKQKQNSPEQKSVSSSTAPNANTSGQAGGTSASQVNGTQTGEAGQANKQDSLHVNGATQKDAPKDNCFAFEYQHKKDAKEQDIENFLDYTNAFPILHSNYNEKSICVKINQKTVDFKIAKYKSTPEIRLGSVVGPDTVIRVSYCIGKVNPCREACAQHKKRFMDDLMSDATDEDSFNDSWGKGDENHKKALKDKAKELRGIASADDHLDEASVQRDWAELQKQEWVCK